MKKSTLALLALTPTFLLGGCVSITPASYLQSTYLDVKGTTPRTYQSTNTVDAAGKCAMFNIQEGIASFNAVYADEPAKPGTKEIRARSEVGMAAVVVLEPTATGTGTSITVWISNHYPFKGTLSERISKGC